MTSIGAGTSAASSTVRDEAILAAGKLRGAIGGPGGIVAKYVVTSCLAVAGSKPPQTRSVALFGR